MNSAKLRKLKNENSSGTNFRIIIQRKGTRDDGRGYAPTQSEATRRFDLIMKEVSNFEFAELWYEEKLVKKV